MEDCLLGVPWWLSDSSSQCHRYVCGLWFWYFLIILTIFGVGWIEKVNGLPTCGQLTVIECPKILNWKKRVLFWLRWQHECLKLIANHSITCFTQCHCDTSRRQIGSYPFHYMFYWMPMGRLVPNHSITCFTHCHCETSIIQIGS